jgi:hypothetical protein
MLFHISVIMLMAAAMAAFLILWYFWVKKKIEGSYFLDDEEQVLFPFRYFSWILLGLVLVTGLAQIHFLRVSAAVHERLAGVSDIYRMNKACAAEMEDLKGMIDGVRTDLNTGLTRISRHDVIDKGLSELSAAPGEWGASASKGGPVTPPVNAARDSEVAVGNPAAALDREAAALKAPKMAAKPAPLSPEAKQKPSDPNKIWSMGMNLAGRITADSVRVRKKPDLKAPILGALKLGAEVKVTEKRVVDEEVWFRVITPSGRAGWVDFRFLKLQEASASLPAGS